MVICLVANKASEMKEGPGWSNSGPLTPPNISCTTKTAKMERQRNEVSENKHNIGKTFDLSMSKNDSSRGSLSFVERKLWVIKREIVALFFSIWVEVSEKSMEREEFI